MRFDWVCSRPAVSAISTSTPRLRATCSASNTTAALSAPVRWAITGTSLRSPHCWSCSTAAARKVSPAASITLSPSSRYRRASLPMVVVLPAPLTPTTRITNGRGAGGITSGCSTGVNSASISARKASSAPRPASSSRRLSRSVSPLTICCVASTPTSASSSCVSTSSSEVVSSCFSPSSTSATPRLKLWRVRASPVRMRPNRPARAGVAAGPGASVAGCDSGAAGASGVASGAADGSSADCDSADCDSADSLSGSPFFLRKPNMAAVHAGGRPC